MFVLFEFQNLVIFSLIKSIGHSDTYSTSGSINLNANDGWNEIAMDCIGYTDSLNQTASVIDIELSVNNNGESALSSYLVMYDDQSNSYPDVYNSSLPCIEKMYPYARFLEPIDLYNSKTFEKSISIHQHIQPRNWWLYLVNCNQSVIYSNISYTVNFVDTNVSQDTSGCTPWGPSCQWYSKDGKYLLNMSDIDEISLSLQDPDHAELYYIYTPCRNTLLCDNIYAMTYLANATSFECDKYFAIWENGENKPYYNEELKEWQFIYTNGESCGGFKMEFTVYWKCDESFNTPQIVKMVKDEECLYHMIIYSALACN